MAARTELLRAWLLHSRPFRDTSLLLDFLTLERGRISAVAKGVRSNKSRGRSILQPFTSLQISVSGKHELQTLCTFETVSTSVGQLSGERLFAGFYMNELLVKLLPAQEAEQELFNVYELTLTGLSRAQEVEPLLRVFEMQLLDSLGYGVQFDHDAENAEPIEDAAWYYLQTDSGFVKQLQLQQDDDSREQAGLYPGLELRNISQRNFATPSTRRFAKRLLRELLQRQLGNREISSRDLFKRPASNA